MQHAIDAARRYRNSENEVERQRGEKQLAQFGETVEEWLRNGWRVVQLTLTAFAERGYTFDEPDEDGHVNAFGEHSLHALDLVMIAEEVPAEAFDE
jgi:hypothetical protein